MRTNRRVGWLFLPLILALIAATLVMVNLGSAQEGQAAGPQAPREVSLKWEDDFESYEPGWTYTEAFPVENYTHAGLKDMFVFTDTFHSGQQSLKGHGVFGDCLGSVAYRPIEGYAPISVTAWIRNGSGNPEFDELSGCHPVFGALQLSTGPAWDAGHRGLLSFREEGPAGSPEYSIYGGSWETDEPADAIFLDSFDVATWYKVTVKYELINSNTAHLTYWVNGELKGEQDVPLRDFEGSLAYLGLWVGEGVAWFDDVAVSASDTAPASQDLAILKEASAVVMDPDSAFSYHITVHNNGAGTASAVSVEDVLPAELTFQSVNASVGSCEETAGTVICELGDLAEGATATIDIEVTAPSSEGGIMNSASVVFEGLDLNPANNADRAAVIVGEAETLYLPLIYNEAR